MAILAEPVRPAAEVGAPAPPARLVSLDVFRGVAILGMILVNNPGTWSAIYPPLRHAAWHGWTPTDLVFPFFLFIVGVAIPLAFTKRLARGADRGDLVRKTVKRAAVLFAIGLGLAFYSRGWRFLAGEGIDLSDFRILGVLQRIALCYLAASLLFLTTSARTQLVVGAGILVGYWAAMTLVPVPGVGAGHLDVPAETLSAFVDRLLLGQHLWAGADKLWDPEGLLSTFPAVVTTLLGVVAGRWVLRDRGASAETAARLMATGLALGAVGAMWGWVFPVNKALWTSSYVLLTGGFAFSALGACYWAADVRGWRGWTRPFVAYGVNALLVFVGSSLLAQTLVRIRVAGSGGPQSLQSWIYQTVFAPVGPAEVSSLLYALVWVGGWYLVLRALHERGIVWKV
ncbi:acyltransferase family protein [Rubrivirga sp. IMCC43871]|uniref:acyltransferase family protein n=1 Tax=Rubrivirga sp. IMCC43871 TaxID=3391575 RepID=UPI0039900B0E